MDLSLTNRTALVAGSSRGIGKAIALALLQEGCRVCITGRDSASLQDAEVSLHASVPGAHILPFSGDMSDAAVITEAVIAIESRWGAPDILIANLGTGSGKPGWQQDESEWERLFNLNFFASVRLAQAVIPAIQRNGGGSIVFISSITGIEATPAPLPYSASKAALINYSKNLARVVAPLNIRVNCIAPGNVLFPGGSWEKHLANRREQVEKYIQTEVPQQRFGTPEEIAALAVFLCSPQAAFATGSCYVMDGGQTRTL